MIVMQHEIVAACMPLTAERGVCRLPRMFRYFESSRKQLIFFIIHALLSSNPPLH